MIRFRRVLKHSLLFVVPGLLCELDCSDGPMPAGFFSDDDYSQYPVTIAAGDGFVLTPSQPAPKKRHHHRHTNKMTRMDRLHERQGNQKVKMRILATCVLLGYIVYLGVTALR